MYVWFLIIVILSKSTGSMTTSLYLPPSVNVNTEEICNSVGEDVTTKLVKENDDILAFWSCNKKTMEDIQKALPPEL